MEKERLERRREGLNEYKLWKQGSLRGYKIIGQWIINRYGLKDEDFESLRREQRMYFNRGYRKRLKLKKQEEESRKN